MDLSENLKRLEKEREELRAEMSKALAPDNAQPKESSPDKEQKEKETSASAAARPIEEIEKDSQIVEKRIAVTQKALDDEITLKKLAGELTELGEEKKAANGPRNYEKTPLEIAAQQAEQEFSARLPELLKAGVTEMSADLANSMYICREGADSEPPWKKDTSVQIKMVEQPEAHARAYAMGKPTEPRLFLGKETSFEGGHPSVDKNMAGDSRAEADWSIPPTEPHRSVEELKDSNALPKKPTTIVVKNLMPGSIVLEGIAGAIDTFGKGGANQTWAVLAAVTTTNPAYDVENDKLKRRDSMDFNIASSKDDRFIKVALQMEPEYGARKKDEHDADIASAKAEKDRQDQGDKALQAEVAKIFTPTQEAAIDTRSSKESEALVKKQEEERKAFVEMFDKFKGLDPESAAKIEKGAKELMESMNRRHEEERQQIEKSWQR
jgi:hypothetical protein